MGGYRAGGPYREMMLPSLSHSAKGDSSRQSVFPALSLTNEAKMPLHETERARIVSAAAKHDMKRRRSDEAALRKLLVPVRIGCSIRAGAAELRVVEGTGASSSSRRAVDPGLHQQPARQVPCAGTTGAASEVRRPEMAVTARSRDRWLLLRRF